MFARLFVAVVALASTALTAQEEASHLHLPAPAGWQAGPDGRSLQPPGGNAAIIFTPSTAFSGTAEEWMERSWNDVARELKVVSGPVSGTQGRFLTRHGVFQQANGTNVWLCLNTVVENGRGEGVIFFAADPEKFHAHLAALNAMLQDVKATTSSEPTTEANTMPDRTTNANLTLDDYVVIAPEGWQVQRRADHILLTQEPDMAGCLIQILPPQPSSGDLEKDAAAVFETMYSGWQYQKTGADRFTLSRGFLPAGLEFCLLEAPMSATTADGRYQLEDGAALVVRAGDKVAIIAVRHRGLLAHTDCLRKYTTWHRFFNRFTVRGAPLPPSSQPASAARLVGRWTMAESGASGEYLFAANGHYAFNGALGTSTTTSDFRYEYLHLTTYAFEGDGSYVLSGPDLTLTKRTTAAPEQVRVRFEQVNHGGTGWTDRLYLRTTDLQGENEVRYEKKND